MKRQLCFQETAFCAERSLAMQALVDFSAHGGGTWQVARTLVGGISLLEGLGHRREGSGATILYEKPGKRIDDVEDNPLSAILD